MTRILLTCGGGMSTAILAKNLMKIGSEKNNELHVDACGFETIDHYLSNDSDYVMVLVAPQIKHKFNEVSEIVSKYDIVSDQIKFDEYAPIGAKKLYDRVVEGELWKK